jgi:hypothetical protein
MAAASATRTKALSSGSKPSIPRVGGHPSVVDPSLELHRVEPQVATPLDVGNPPLRDESADVPDADAKHLGDALNVKEKR